MNSKKEVQHVYLVGAKSLGAYGGYETFVYKLTEYHQNKENIKYHVACKANGDGCMDESKFDGVTKINDHEFEFHNAHCFKIDVPQIGPAQAIYYDIAALKACCEHIKKNHIPHPIVYIMACRIGPFASHFYREIHKLGGTVYLNPDGHEWMRAKWSAPIRKYWKISEQMMVKYCDLAISNNANKIERYVNTSIILSLWAGIALCFGIKAIDTDFIPFFFGKGYMRCAELLEWLSIVIIIKAISNILRTQYLIPMEKDKEFNISVIVAAIVNVILNYILIPTYGAMGAVIGTLVAETIVLFLYAVFSKCVIKFDKVILPGMLFVIAGIVMNMVVDVVKDKITINSLFLRLVVEVCIGGLIYCVLTFVGILLIKKPQKTLNL